MLDQAIHESTCRHGAGLKVRWLTGLPDLQALGAAYPEFLSRVGPQRIFLEPSRVELLWEMYETLAGEPAWLWVEQDGRGVGLAPLQLTRKDLTRGGARCLHPYGNVRGALSQWYTDWLIPDAALRPAVLKAIQQALTTTYAERWDLLELDLLDITAPTTVAMRDLWPSESWRKDPAITAAVELRGDFESYTAVQFSGKFLRELERERRKLTRLWGTPVITCTATITAERWERIKTLHQARQTLIREKGKARIPLFESTIRGAAFERLLHWGEETGRSRHYWLEIEGRLAGFMLGLAEEETLFLQLTAIDETYAAVSPMRILLWDLLKQEAERGTQTVEFGVGINLFKRQFGTKFCGMVDLEWVNPASIGSRLRTGWLRMIRRMRARMQ